jgi:LacI family transcriptional regulator
MLGQHLIRLGCKNIRFVVRPGSASSVNARLSGFREALIQHNLPILDSIVAHGDPTSREFIRKLRPGFDCDAIICANDATARQLIDVLHSLKIKIPEQVRIVGFDDVRGASLASVPLTTVRQPLSEIAEIAFRALQGRIHEPGIPPRTITLQPRLVIRESCGTYLGASVRKPVS